MPHPEQIDTLHTKSVKFKDFVLLFFVVACCLPCEGKLEFPNSKKQLYQAPMASQVGKSDRNPGQGH